MLSAAKHLAADRDRPFAVLRVTRCDCSHCQGLFFTIAPCLKCPVRLLHSLPHVGGTSPLASTERYFCGIAKGSRPLPGFGERCLGDCVQRPPKNLFFSFCSASAAAREEHDALRIWAVQVSKNLQKAVNLSTMDASSHFLVEREIRCPKGAQ